jgi:hypothetical protein
MISLKRGTNEPTQTQWINTLPNYNPNPTTPILIPVFQSLSIKAFGPGLLAFGRGASWKITLPSILEGTLGRT